MPPGHQAVANVQVRDISRHEFEITIEGFQGDKRTEAFALSRPLRAWHVLFTRKRGINPREVGGPRPFIEGLSQDRVVLESIGALGFARIDSSGERASWDRDLGRREQHAKLRGGQETPRVARTGIR